MEKQRVALVVPNYKLRELFGSPTGAPMGPALIAAQLRREGWPVALLDGDAENLSQQEMVARLQAWNPQCVGISCNYVTKHNPTLELARLIKRHLGVYVFVGGNHASACAEELLRESAGAVDAVLRGEGEVNLPPLLRALASGQDWDAVPGLVRLKDGRPAQNPPPLLVADLDDLAPPAYDLLPMDRYTRHALVTSRGCPFRCDYCASTVVAGGRLRFRSGQLLAQEVAGLFAAHGPKPLWISDDTFTVNRRHVQDFLGYLQDLPFVPEWSCMANLTSLTEGLLFSLGKAGCQYVSVGVESTHPAQARFLGKKVSDELVMDKVEAIHRAGMRAYGFFIIGFPGENRQTLQSRLDLLGRARFDGVGVNLLIPLPGTALWQELSAQGLVSLADLDKDRLFARIEKTEVSEATARLLSRWTELSPAELRQGVEDCLKVVEEANRAAA